jgi:ribosomal peptide maturation radical SAM protein 1
MAAARVQFVSMPWDRLEHPPIQLGILQRVLEREGIASHVRCVKLDFLEHCITETAGAAADHRLGLDEYDLVVEWSRDVGLGDWIFTEPCVERDQGYRALLRDHAVPERDISVAERFRALVPSFLDLSADVIADTAPAIVGFTTGAHQTVASLELAKRLKARLPAVKIVFGGANCQGPMGAALQRTFPWIDVVVRGEGEGVLAGLVGDLLAGSGIRPQPGLCYTVKGHPIAIDEAASSLPPDEIPLPRYDEYFEELDHMSFGETLRPRVTFLYESARGCWWGAKSHCTFCGINALNMPFRSKSPDRVVDELLELTDRYGSRKFLIVDYILDWRYFAEVLPRLRDAGQELRLFCETKANLRKEEVRVLREAGFVSVQAGVESLSDPILKLIRKGVTAFQNIRLLKWCAESNVRLYWNIVYGLPGEPPAEYARMADIMRSLVHLEPPRLVPLSLDRFSPYHQQPFAFGLIPTGARRDYRFIYGGLDEDALNDLAYCFEYRHADGRDPASYVRPLREVVEAWQASRETALGSLRYRRGRQPLIVTDRRPGLPAYEYRFGAVEAAAYLACEDGATFDEIETAVRSAGHTGVSTAQLGEFFEELTQARLIYRDGDQYLALALATSAGGRCAAGAGNFLNQSQAPAIPVFAGAPASRT